MTDICAGVALSEGNHFPLLPLPSGCSSSRLSTCFCEWPCVPCGWSFCRSPAVGDVGGSRACSNLSACWRTTAALSGCSPWSTLIEWNCWTTKSVEVEGEEEGEREDWLWCSPWLVSCKSCNKSVWYLSMVLGCRSKLLPLVMSGGGAVVLQSCSSSTCVLLLDPNLSRSLVRTEIPLVHWYTLTALANARLGNPFPLLLLLVWPTDSNSRTSWYFLCECRLPRW